MSINDNIKQEKADHTPEELSLEDTVKQLSERLRVAENCIKNYQNTFDTIDKHFKYIEDRVLPDIIKLQQSVNYLQSKVDAMPSTTPWAPPAWMAQTLYGRMPEPKSSPIPSFHSEQPKFQLPNSSLNYSDNITDLMSNWQILANWIDRVLAAFHGYPLNSFVRLETESVQERLAVLTDLFEQQNPNMDPSVFTRYFLIDIDRLSPVFQPMGYDVSRQKVKTLVQRLKVFQRSEFSSMIVKLKTAKINDSLDDLKSSCEYLKDLKDCILGITHDPFLVNQLQIVFQSVETPYRYR